MSVIGPRPGLWNQDILTAERDNNKTCTKDLKSGICTKVNFSGSSQ